MAGEGSRFKDAGYKVPKPLIEFDNKPLFINSLKTIDNVQFESITFVVREEFIKEYHIDETIKKWFPEAYIIAVKETTRGAAETAFFAMRELILADIADFTDRVLVMDCDVIVESEAWKKAITHPKSDGILLSFKSENPRYSYAVVYNGEVIRTAEKNPISCNALTSPYFFKKIEDFVDAFHEMEDANADGEMYVSNIYNYLIADGKHITLIDADSITSLGTPEELKAAQK